MCDLCRDLHDYGGRHKLQNQHEIAYLRKSILVDKDGHIVVVINIVFIIYGQPYFNSN